MVNPKTAPRHKNFLRPSHQHLSLAFCIFITPLLRHDSHTIQFTHLRVYNSICLVYSQSCVITITVNGGIFFQLPKIKAIPQAPILPSPRQLLIYPLCLWKTRLLWTSHINESQYVAMCDWLLSLSMFSRFTHVVTWTSKPFLFTDK